MEDFAELLAVWESGARKEVRADLKHRITACLADTQQPGPRAGNRTVARRPRRLPRNLRGRGSPVQRRDSTDERAYGNSVGPGLGEAGFDARERKVPGVQDDGGDLGAVRPDVRGIAIAIRVRR
ncbi:hypothetical protein JBE27_34485 [Streptomyces albiflaviniger]|nr:hypothetical protein [Streptomyces albiflaviniger]